MKLYEIAASAENITLKDVADHKKLAQKLGISVNQLKEMSDKEIVLLLQNIGYNDFTPDDQFDKHELAMGISTELEHTKSHLVAKLIAKDHLKEISDYYTRLEAMEKESKNN